jgi:hypothetical protein
LHYNIAITIRTRSLDTVLGNPALLCQLIVIQHETTNVDQPTKYLIEQIEEHYGQEEHASGDSSDDTNALVSTSKTMTMSSTDFIIDRIRIEKIEDNGIHDRIRKKDPHRFLNDNQYS